MFRIILGVILPLVCLGVEYTWRFCTTAFFDPIPTWFHVAMITFVAYANGWILFSFANPDYKPLKRDALIIGVSIGISLIYSLRFIPLLPLVLMCFIMWGGLLVYGPMVSFIVAVGLARKLSAVDPEAKPRVANPAISKAVFLGVCAGVMCIFLAELPHSITRHALERALSADPVEARRGINSLISFGSQDELLKMCYSDKAQMSDFVNVAMFQFKPIDPTKARKVFYRVTGVPFNREKFPQQFLSKGDEFFSRRWDHDLAGEEVGGRVDDLTLKNSDLEITCDPNSASADLDWTFVFENMSNSQAEARTNIALPPGAVVSDLTLWINGVPQPAAFGSKSKTRAAYQAVVSRSRDPVLVTSAGGDRVLLQCFPVPVKGLMKTRVRISAPLSLDRDKATLVLPKLIENNFDIFTPTKTTLRSTTPVEKKPHSLIASNTSGAYAYSLKGVIDQNKFDSTVEPIVFQRNPNAPAASKIFTINKTTSLLTQNIKMVHEEPTDNVVIVLDGSKSMRPFTQDVSQALSSISDRLPWSIVLASDEISALTPEDSLYKQLTPKVVASNLANLKFQGGPDNATALAIASKIAAQKGMLKFSGFMDLSLSWLMISI
ncbi:MAG: VIT domain-containing protein [Candidatus Melainabacteria bacterium]|nr:VIT domain-containing protein [Candidatus Melainabacteria bacterium]